MKNFILFIFCITVVFFQLSVEGVFFSAYRIPDLALAFVISLVLILGFNESLKWILLVGILIDAGSGSVFGAVTLSLFGVSLVVSQLTDIADIRSRKMFFLAVFAAFVAISEIAKDFLISKSQSLKSYYLKELAVSYPIFFSVDYLLKIVYTIVAAYCIYYILRRVSRKLFFEPIRFSKAKP